LIEVEGSNSLTHLDLLVSPRIGKIDGTAVAATFVQMLKSAEDSPESWSQSGTEMWSQAKTVRVKREYPIPTRRAKILPFHIMKLQSPGN
jgi:hypothetical protein